MISEILEYSLLVSCYDTLCISGDFKRYLALSNLYTQCKSVCVKTTQCLCVQQTKMFRAGLVVVVKGGTLAGGMIIRHFF